MSYYLSNQAAVLKEMNRFDEAKKILKETIKLEKKIMPNNPCRSITINNLAILLADQGQKQEALNLHYVAL